MKLAFKNKWGKGFIEKEVDIKINMMTLYAVCEENDLTFKDLKDEKKISSFDFRSELLYYGYISACKDKFKKPEYTKIQAIIWNEHLSQSASEELRQKLSLFYTGMAKFTGGDKKKVAGKKSNQVS